MKRFLLAVSALVLVLGLWTGAATAEEVAIQVSPSTINLAYEGTTVTVHAETPYWGVVKATLTLNGQAVWWTKADARGELVAKFNVEDVKEIIAVPSADLRLEGEVVTASGIVPFFGEDTVKVIDRSGKK